MRMFTIISVGFLAGLVMGGCSSYHTGKHATTAHAKAVISGPGISGEAHLYEEYEGRVRIKVTLKGRPDSKLAPGLHAIHIHETGNCEPFSAAKGHYDGNIDLQVNPDANVSPGLGNHPYHLGDLPNLSVVTMGIDRWELGRCQPIQEARLLTNVRRALGDRRVGAGANGLYRRGGPDGGIRGADDRLSPVGSCT